MAKKTKKARPKPPTQRPSARKGMKRLVRRKTQSPKPAKANKPPTRAAAKRSPLPPSKGKPARRASPPAPALPKPIALFSRKVLEEEDAPVAVRTFNEARAGIEKSKELDVRTGRVKPVEGSTADTDLAEFEEVPPSPPPARPQLGRPVAPQMEPLTGRLAVPQQKQDEDFRLAAPTKGRKTAPPTREDLGKIELRMQRGTTDKTVARASPDYLQRSFKKAQESGKTSASPTDASKPSEEEAFEVENDRPERRLDASLTDFGDVEIAQQTRKGRRTLGTLDADESKEKES